MVGAQLRYATKNAGTSYIELGPTISINQLPKPIYTWKKNGVKIVEDARVGISKKHALYIADLRSSDAGTYTCEVENPIMKNAGRANAMQISKRIQLTVSGLCQLY